MGLLGEDRGDEFTLDKIESMDVDYEAAMVKRAAIHAAIKEELDERAAKKARRHPSAAQLTGTVDKGHRPVLMAVATSGGGRQPALRPCPRIPRLRGLAGRVRFIGHRKVEQYCVGNDSCGDKDSALSGSIRALKGCEAVLCSKIGFEPWGELEAAGIQPNGEHAMEPIEEAVLEVYQK